jgi:hypothetical protein
MRGEKKEYLHFFPSDRPRCEASALAAAYAAGKGGDTPYPLRVRSGG